MQRDGLTLHHDIAGSGPVLLLTHGFRASSTMWRDNVPALVAAGWRVVTVESRRGAVAWALWASLRFLSPLIKPDVRISRIRLPDRLHLKAHGGGPRWTRRSRITPSSPNTTLSGKRLVPRDDTLWRLTRK